MDALQAKRTAGSMLLVGFHGATLDEATARHLKELAPGGVILFTRNFENPAQLHSLVESVREASGTQDLMVAVDQEGGRVNRFKEPFTIFPSAREIGSTGNDYLPYVMGKAMGLELLAAGVNTNLAPVLDVDTNGKNPVIGDRSYGSDPYLVSRMGIQLIAGMQEAGLVCCGKHFPGHGDTFEDSHLTLPAVSHSLDRLMEIELVPFANAADAGVDMIMTAHIIMKAIDPEFPATLSHKILTGLLKTRLGFEGVIVTDDMEMKAIADNFGGPDAAVKSVIAGADLVCVCHTASLQTEIRDRIASAIVAKEISEDRLSDAVTRLARLKNRITWKLPGMDLIGCKAHKVIVSEIKEQIQG